MNTKAATYRQLELIPYSVSATQRCQPAPLLSWMMRFFRQIKAPTPQAAIPFVWKSMDAAGRTWWNVFDRLTGQTTLRMSDEQFWGWLEQRYYHSL